MIGTKLAGRYEVRRELGRGGMGVVYLAHDPMLDREVAAKVITPALLSPEAEQRFRREAKVIARMDHPAIVVVYDIGEHEGSLFFVMPYVTGTNLRDLIHNRALRLGEIVDIGIQVAEALEYSHSRDIIHRDIKPENILVNRETAGTVRVRITDFGLARTGSEDPITRSGAVVGTVAYLSPEQISSAPITPRTDVYATGTVLYECLVGRTPYQGEIQSVLYRIAHENPQSPRERGADVQEEFERIVMQCLEKDPAKRPSSAQELSESLSRYRATLPEDEKTRTMQSILAARQTLVYDRPAAPAFIGREKEFGELQKRLNAALQGECQLAVLSGEPGSGKSRLLEELENLARARKIRVLHGRFVEQDRSFPYQGFCEVIQEYFRWKATSMISVQPDFSDLTQDLVSLFPVLSEIAEIRTSSITRLHDVKERRKIEDRTYIFELLARCIARIGGGRPLVILLEDLHSADVSLEALQYIVRRLGPTPTLILGTYRSTEVDRHHPLHTMLENFENDRRFSALTVERFTAPEHRSFLEAILGTTRLDDALSARIFEATEGNPYFTRELIRSLMDAGHIVTDATGLTQLRESSVSFEQLPATIQQAVERRIERLPEVLRDVLAFASVLGKEFEFRDLEMLLEDRDEKLEDIVDLLIVSGFIEEDRQSRGDRLVFSSGVIRDVLYAGLSRRKRRSLHRRYAEQLERRHSGRIERYDSQLVHHYSNADVPEKVVEFGLRLARKALDAFGAEEAIRAGKIVLEFLDEDVPDNRAHEAEARKMIAAGLRMSGNIESSLNEIERAIRLLEQHGRGAEWLNAVVVAAETAWAGRQVEETIRWVEKGLESARSQQNTTPLSRLLSLGMTVSNLRGDYEKAKEYFEESQALRPAERETEPADRVPEGGRLVVAIPSAIQAIHPSAIRLDEEEEIVSNVFETLLTRDARGNLIPLLCEHWEITDRGKSVLFQLRPGVLFQNGKKLTSHEVKHSLEQAVRMSPGTLAPAMAPVEGMAEFRSGEAQSVSGLEIVSDRELRIHLTEHLPIYPSLLTDIRASVALESEGRLWGTGPFLIESSGENRIVLKRNTDYWRGTPPRLDTIEFRTSLSAADAAQGLKVGEFDLVRDLLPQDLDEILRDRRLRAGLVEAPRKNVHIVLFNSNSETGQIAAFRKAVTNAVHPHDLVRRTLGRFAQPAEGLLPPGVLGHDPGRRRHPLSRERIESLLESSNLTWPVKLRAAVHPVLQDRYAGFTKALLKVWSDIGVEIDIVTNDMKSYLQSALENEGIDLLLGRYVADYDDPDNFTYGLFHSKMGRFRKFYSSPELDHLIEEARMESVPAAREKLYARVENHLQDTAFVLPMFHDINYRVAGPRVRNLTLQSSPPYVNYARVGKVESVQTVAQKSAGTIHVPIAGEVHNLDPSLVFLVVQSEVIPTIYETLTKESEGARIAPWLASYYRAEDGGRKFRFRLREEVRFHDGRRLTSRDVRYSFEHLLQNRSSASRFLLSPIRGAKEMLEGQATDLKGFLIHSEIEFTIELEQPVSFFPALLAHTPAAIIPEGTDFNNAKHREDFSGTGPFRLVRFDPGRTLELEANPDYWREGYPRCDGLVFHFGLPPAEILSGFRSGRFSFASDLFPADVDALRRDPDFFCRYGETPRLSTYHITFNSHDGPLSDERYRHHIVRSVDIEGLVRRNLGRLAIPAQGIIPPGLLGYEPIRKMAQPVEILPVKGDLKLTCIINSVYEGAYSALANDLLSVLAQAGYNVQAAHQSRREYDRALISGTVDMVITRWVADYPDADTFAHSLLHSKRGILGRLVGAPDIDSLIERGRTETDTQVRHDIYREIEGIIQQRALMLPLFHEQAYCFARPEIENFEVSFTSPLIPYEKIFLKR